MTSVSLNLLPVTYIRQNLKPTVALKLQKNQSFFSILTEKIVVTVLAKETSHMAMEMKHKYFKTTDYSTILRFQMIKTLGAQRNQSEPRLKALVHKLTSALAGVRFPHRQPPTLYIFNS